MSPPRVKVGQSDGAYALLQGSVFDKKDNVLLSAEVARVEAPILSVEGETVLGRTPAAEGAAQPAKHFIHLTEKMSVSRKHAAISCGSHDGAWQIRCLSKNGITVDRRALKPEDGAVSLSHLSTIRIGPAYVYFTLPAVDSTSTSTSKPAPSERKPAALGGSSRGKYAVLMEQACRSAEQQNELLNGGMTKNELVDRIIRLNAEYAPADKRRLLLNGVGEQLRKRATNLTNPGSEKFSNNDVWALPADFSEATAGGAGVKRKASSASPPPPQPPPAERRSQQSQSPLSQQQQQQQGHRGSEATSKFDCDAPPLLI